MEGWNGASVKDNVLIITLFVVKPVCFVYKVQVCLLCTCMDIMYVCTLPSENCAAVWKECPCSWFLCAKTPDMLRKSSRWSSKISIACCNCLLFPSHLGAFKVLFNSGNWLYSWKTWTLTLDPWPLTPLSCASRPAQYPSLRILWETHLESSWVPLQLESSWYSLAFAAKIATLFSWWWKHRSDWFKSQVWTSNHKHRSKANRKHWGREG